MGKEKQLEAMGRLLHIMDELREKCPWDHKQTMESLRCNTIEETYELAGAVLENNLDEVRKELGDLLLHIVFYAKIGSEQGAFDFADVANGICEKLIVRHPHVFGETKVKSDADIRSNWEKIKLSEGRKSVLEGIPEALPAMVKAIRLQEKAQGIGFDWSENEGGWDKLKEEMAEFEAELKNGTAEHREEALGSIVCDPLKLTFQPYATNDASAYLMAAAGKYAFQVSYGSRDHVVSFEVEADTNGLFDSVHQLFYVLLFPKNICIDNQQVGSGDTPSPIVFNPIARKK